MMKFKKWIIVLLFLLSACSNDTVKDNGDWNLDAKYNSSFNNYIAGFSPICDTEKGIITYLHLEGSTSTYYYPLYIQDNKVSSMLSDVASVCTISNPDTCEGLIEAAHVNYLYYYKGNIYFIKEDYSSFDYVDASIKRADLDGKNQKDVFTFETREIDEFEHFSSSLQFHRNKVYAIYYDELYIGDLDSSKLNKVKIDGLEKVWQIFLVEDTLYIAAFEYDDGTKLHFNVLLACDLNGNVKEIAYEDKYVRLIDKENVFYMNILEDGTVEWYVMGIDSGKEKRIGDSYSQIMKYEDTYLLESRDNFEGVRKFSLLDKEGNIVYTKDYSELGYVNDGLLYIGNRYYVYANSMDATYDWYGYYEINEEGISDLIMLEK